jgi:hypothetical protein
MKIEKEDLKDMINTMEEEKKDGSLNLTQVEESKALNGQANRKSVRPDLSDPHQVDEIIEKFGNRKSNQVTLDNLKELDSKT